METEILFLPALSITVFIYTLALIFHTFKSKSNSNTNLPPGSFGWPIIGETFAFLNEPQEKFVGARMKKYSPKVFKTNILGERTAVLCGISGHKFISSNEEKLFMSWRPESTQKLFRSSYQKAASEVTKRADAVHISKAPGFLKPEAVVRYLASMESMVQEHLNHYWEGKSTIEVYGLAQLLVTTLSARFFTGLENNNDRCVKFAELINTITSGLHTFPINLPGTEFYRAMKAAKAMREEILLLIKERKAAVSSTGAKVTDIMSHLLFNPDPAGRFIPDNEVADKVMGLMTGGFHSPSMATSFLVKFLGENPRVCEKVRTEQLEIASSKQDGENDLNWEDIQKMKYSWAVALEVMRLVPPLQGTFREVVADFTYEGYTIPKGWKIYWSSSSTNKIAENFPAPEEFDPSRFENGKAAPAYSNIPFGSGPRICPGKEYARLQLMCFLHHVVTRYKWEVTNTKAKIAGGLNPVPIEGFQIRLQPYNKLASV